MNNIIKIVPYDPNWVSIFDIESNLIKQALGNNYLEIHHIGSTSVPGLAAKPKIDITTVVKNGKFSVQQLEGIGYMYKGEYNVPFKFFFTKRGKHSINLHIFERHHPDIEAHILFRNYLIDNPETKIAYEELKKELLLDASAHHRSHTMLFHYTLRKGDFIRSVLKKTGFNKIRILKCSDDMEWTAARHFRGIFFNAQNAEDSYEWTFNHSDHSHLVLYQKLDIVGYAHIQLLPESKATIHIIAADNDINQKIFLTLIKKWLKNLEVLSICILDKIL